MVSEVIVPFVAASATPTNFCQSGLSSCTTPMAMPGTAETSISPESAAKNRSSGGLIEKDGVL